MDPGGRDTFVWMQNAEPISLYCNDETDGESLRACEQTLESLLSYEIGKSAPQMSSLAWLPPVTPTLISPSGPVTCAKASSSTMVPC